jgi:hypothetical protein
VQESASAAAYNDRSGDELAKEIGLVECAKGEEAGEG